MKSGTDFSSLAMEVLDGIFFWYKAVLPTLKICKFNVNLIYIENTLSILIILVLSSSVSVYLWT